MGWSTVWFLYLRELRSTLRERNVLLYVVVVPLLLYPFLLWLSMAGASMVSAEEERTPVRLAITPPQPTLARALEKERVTVVDSPDPRRDLSKGVLDAVVEVDKERFVHLIYDGRYRRSDLARQRLRPLIRGFREVRLEQVALDNGVTLTELQPLYLDTKDESTSTDLGKLILGTLLPLTLLIVLSLGALYPAVETFAGEHERQTLDTTLGLSVSRWQVVFSKYLLVASLCCLSGVCNLLAVTVSLRSILQPLTDRTQRDITWGWSPTTFVVVALGVIAMSLLVAAGTLLVTAHARTFRQGQAATTPVFMAILLPTGALVDQSLSLDPSTCWIPVVNIALLWRDSLSGHFHGGLALATLLTTACWIGLCLGLLIWRLRVQSRLLGLAVGR